MEAAHLNHETINIQRERDELTRKGLSGDEIKAWFEEKYRIFSREKGSFSCGCCQERVVMVLFQDKAIFRHYSSEACAGERNYTSYMAGRERSRERAQKQAAAKAIIYDALMEADQGYYTVQEGYFYKKELRFVPDFLVSFPNGEQWTIDYVVNLRGDSNFRKKMEQRTRSYKANGFKSLFLIDQEWMAINKERNISFNNCELSIAVPSNETNKAWESYISAQQLNWELYRRYFQTLAVRVESLLYLDLNQAVVYLTRFLHIHDKWGELLFPPLHLPLTQLFLLNEPYLKATGSFSFQFYGEEEESYQQGYIDELQNRLNKYEEELKNKQEREKQSSPRRSTLNRPVQANIDKLQELLQRCLTSPNRSLYPSLEGNLKKAAEYMELYKQGGEDSEKMYRNAYSLLTNLSHPLLGE